MADKAADVLSAGDSSVMKSTKEVWTPGSPWVWSPHYVPQMHLYAETIRDGFHTHRLLRGKPVGKTAVTEFQPRCAATCSRSSQEASKWYRPSLQPPPFVKPVAKEVDKPIDSTAVLETEEDLDETVENKDELCQEDSKEDDVTATEPEETVMEEIFGNLSVESFLEEVHEEASEEKADFKESVAQWVETPSENSSPGDLRTPPVDKLAKYSPKMLSRIYDFEVSDDILASGCWGKVVRTRDLDTGKELVITLYNAAAGEYLDDIDVDLITREAQIQAYLHEEFGCTPAMLGVVVVKGDGEDLVQCGLVQEFRNHHVRAPLSEVLGYSKQQLKDRKLDYGDSTWLKFFIRLVMIIQGLATIDVAHPCVTWDRVFLQVQNGEIIPMIVNCGLSKSSRFTSLKKKSMSISSVPGHHPDPHLLLLAKHLHKMARILDKPEKLLEMCIKLTTGVKKPDSEYVVQKLNKMANKAVEKERGGRGLKSWFARKIRKGL